MTERYSNEINQGLRIKQALREKIENITTALIKRLELYLQSESATKKNFAFFKGIDAAYQFIDGGWSGTSRAIFVFDDGWMLELTSGNHAYLKNEKLFFHVKSGEGPGGTRYNPPSITSYPDSLTSLYELDRTLDQLLLTIYDRFVPLRTWFDDLKVRG